MLPVAATFLAVATLIVWLGSRPRQVVALRVPGTDQSPGTAQGTGSANPVLTGQLVRSDGQAAELPGLWPGFRGPNGDGMAPESSGLLKAWPPTGPRALWSVELGEGYAGPAVRAGRIYLMDYDREKKQDALRCLSLADGKEIWRYTYPNPVKRNHGMSRTVPTVTEKYVIAMGPKCHVLCLDAATGELRWGLDLARQFGATVPPWYAGQCPLVDNGTVILAPGGPKALLLAVDLETGKTVWQSENPKGWKMTHSSVVPMEWGGRRMYVYCANLGVVGVSAKDGAILWDTTDWKISIATIPSPVVLPEGKLFLSGGYDAGSLMMQLREESGRWAAKILFRLGPDVFGATQHSPIFHGQHLFGVRPDGRFVCLDLTGKVVWASDAGHSFGLGSFLMAGEAIFALNDSGRLSLIETDSSKFRPLAQAQVLNGRESWGPMALAGGRLLVRDFSRMVCLDVAKP